MFRITCQHASRLLSQRMERPLPWPQRLRLRLHLLACDACTRVAGQFEAMRLALQSWRERD
ncbi:MAG: zf-HC2 domain-containing protein [Proteobacteria bacterium]|nr:zf-HC2 domain-containing protein [Pseudomonadota bacterium]